MVNSKLSKLSRKSLKSRSLKLKNKRTKKSKISKKNIRKMKGGTLSRMTIHYFTGKMNEIFKDTKKNYLFRQDNVKNLLLFIIKSLEKDYDGEFKNISQKNIKIIPSYEIILAQLNNPENFDAFNQIYNEF